MDKIWERKSFKVGGHWPLWRGWKTRMTTQNRQKSNAKKKVPPPKNHYYVQSTFERIPMYEKRALQIWYIIINNNNLSSNLYIKLIRNKLMLFVNSLFFISISINGLHIKKNARMIINTLPNDYIYVRTTR